MESSDVRDGVLLRILREKPLAPPGPMGTA